MAHQVLLSLALISVAAVVSADLSPSQSPSSSPTASPASPKASPVPSSSAPVPSTSKATAPVAASVPASTISATPGGSPAGSPATNDGLSPPTPIMDALSPVVEEVIPSLAPGPSVVDEALAADTPPSGASSLKVSAAVGATVAAVGCLFF